MGRGKRHGEAYPLRGTDRLPNDIGTVPANR